MQELIQGFLDEANELIVSAEESLLTLESTPGDKEAIGSVFRVLHTLKGSGAMFGFSSVSSFTHLLENIFDSVRAGKISVDKNIINLTFESFDLIKNLLQSANSPIGKNQEEYDRLIQEFENLVNPQAKITRSTTQPTITQTVVTHQPTYYIFFGPNHNLLKNGTNPLYLIDELLSLGKGVAIAHTENIPDFENIVPNNCFVSWDVILCTAAHLNDILDVFIFVEDESKIEIQKISNINLLDHSEFTEKLHNYVGEYNNAAILELQEFASQIENKHKKPAANQNIIHEETKLQPAPPSISAPIAKNENVASEPVKLSQINEVPERSKTSTSIRVSSEKVETLINLVSEMVTTQARLNMLAQNINNTDIMEVAEVLEKLTRQLRDNAFEISLIPISSLVTRFQRLIRDLSKELGKEVDFITEGTETELDKTIIENLSDPLMHIFRNAIDHGLEDVNERIAAGKPAKGKLTFKAYYSGTSVFIDISDDGKGINTNKVYQKALAKGIVNPGQNLTDKQINELIFLPGFSTAESVTDLSGRGVGMDVVKKNINKIQGEVEIFSQLGIGTTFTLKLPLTLSIIDGLLVVIDKTEYIIPILVIEKIAPIAHSLVENAFNNTLVVDNRQIPFVYLRQKFSIDSIPPSQEQVVIVNYGTRQMGIVVDRVLRESQVVVKSIGKHFRDQEIISGATIMGDGTVALVLDTNKIIEKHSV